MSRKSMPMVTAHIGQDVYTSNPCFVSTRFQTEILPMFLAHEYPPLLAPRVRVRAGGLGGKFTIFPLEEVRRRARIDWKRAPGMSYILVPHVAKSFRSTLEAGDPRWKSYALRICSMTKTSAIIRGSRA